MSNLKILDVARHVAFGTLAALTFGGAAHAGNAITQVARQKTVVSYTDLDLSKDADVRELYSRLQRASEKVCHWNRNSQDLRAKRLYNACYQDTLARAVERVDHAAVKVVYAEDDRIRMADDGVKARTGT